jgi:hypothetical protein
VEGITGPQWCTAGIAELCGYNPKSLYPLALLLRRSLWPLDFLNPWLLILDRAPQRIPGIVPWNSLVSLRLTSNLEMPLAPPDGIDGIFGKPESDRCQIMPKDLIV